MSRYRLIFVVSLLVSALWGMGAQALFGQSCEDLPLSTINRVGVTTDLGYPGDTVWATFSIENDSVLASFLIFIRYDQAVVTPLTSIEGDPLVQKVGRLAGATSFYTLFSDVPADSGAIISALNVQPGPSDDTLPSGSGAVFKIPFVVNPSAAPGDSARFWFPRYSTYVVDTTVFPPDTLQSICRGSQFAALYNEPAYSVLIWPTPDESYLHVIEKQPIAGMFSALPRSVWAGTEVTLHWGTLNTDSVRIDPIDTIFTDPSGYYSDYPDTTTTYHMTAYGGILTAEDSMLVHVVPYGENRYPWLDPFGPITVTAGETVYQWVYGFDPDGTQPILSTSALPPNANFDDYGGYGLLQWPTTIDDIGVHQVWVRVHDIVDPSLADSLLLTITVVEANYPPSATFPTETAALFEQDTLSFMVTTYDSNGVPPAIVAHVFGGGPLADNMSFVDFGDGTGLFTFIPDLYQGNDEPGLYYIGFTLIDGADPNLTVETGLKGIRVYNRNSGAELPQINIPPESLLVVSEGDSLVFDVTATTSIGDLPVLTSDVLPPGATLTNAPGTTSGNHKIFRYYPGFDQAGTHDVTLIATNLDLVDSVVVTITVEDGNQPPWILVPPGQPDTLTEGTVIYIHVLGIDYDSTAPVLSASLDGEDTLATNMTFVDSANGVGLLTFAPDQTQAYLCAPTFFYLKFHAQDAEPPYVVVNSATYTIKLFDSGESCCIGTVGDVDYSDGGNGEPNIGDLTRLVDYLFRGGGIPCLLEADIDGGGIAISDITALVAYLFSGAGPLPACP